MHICKNTCEWLPNTRCFVFYSIFPSASSFANLSRCGVFLSRHPRVWNTLSRAFAENPEKNSLCSLANTYWNICSPPAMRKSLNFIRAACRPSPLPPPPPPPPSPPHPPLHPQPRAPDFSGHCRAPTATARSQWVQPDTASARSQWALPLSIEWGGAIPAS